MPCEMVVQTVHGRTRCTEPDSATLDLDMYRWSMRVCQFHASHPEKPQCVAVLPYGIESSGRCQAVASVPAENPQTCLIHREQMNAPELRRQDPWESPSEFRMRICGEFPDMTRPAPPGFIIDEPATVQDPLVDDPVEIEEARRQWERENQEAWEIREARNMPSVNFSQVAMPFVAALVQRLGGEVTVPSRRMERGESLIYERVTGGLRFRIMRGSEVVRTSYTVMIQEIAGPPPAPPIQTKYEIEKVRDEEEFELRKTLKKCEECGFQFEVFCISKDGKPECPYCALKKIEAVDKSSEIARLEAALRSAQEQAQVEHAKASRLEMMVQEKIDLVNRKSNQIRQLTEQLQASGQAPVASNHTQPVLIPTDQIPRRSALADARYPIPPIRGGIGARIEAVAHEFGGVVQRHQMSQQAPIGIHRVEESHDFTIIVPMRSQLEEPNL